MKRMGPGWKLPVFCGIALIVAMRFGAPTLTPAAPPAASPAPTASATPVPDYSGEVTKLKTADELFDYISKYATVEDLQPDDALTREEQLAKMRELLQGKIAHLRPAIAAFLKQYPKDPRRCDVELQRIFFLKEADNISDEDAATTLKAVAAAPDASTNARHRARGALLQNDLEQVDPSKGLTPALEAELADYERDFPDDDAGKDLVSLRLRLLRDAGTEKIAAALQGLTKSPNKATATAANEQLALLTQPVDLHFDDAVDGQPIDVAKYRGKVVLLDFWATWCGPCMAKLPEIQALNVKYKDKGFQLVGVSLDQDKAALLKTIKAKKMDWPEYCDGKGWESAVGTRFGVQAIPAAWLLDKKGLAHAVDPDADLDQQIDKLLAENL